jgi:hypothetical protein
MKRFIILALLSAVAVILLLGVEVGISAGSGVANGPATVLLPPREYKTAPADLPSFTVEQRPGERGDGYLFVSMFKRQSELRSFNLILDDNGEPVFYQPLDTIRSSNDFKKQPNGLLTYFSSEGGNVTYIALNSHYEKVREIRAVQDSQSEEPFEIDNHGLQILANGHALFMIHDKRTVDMSVIVPSGNPEALVTGCVIQEVDEDNNLLFQWNSWDHIPITDSRAPLDRARIAYVHCNSLEIDNDGNLLLSNRNLNELTKIARPGGEIIWRLGGKKNEFSFLNDEGFTIQHDARRLDNGHITLYDNADPEIGKNSRGVEYQVDEINKTVQLVAEYRNSPETFGQFMGNMQRLPNGNTLIGWGTATAPVFTEFNGSGEKLLEFTSTEGMFTYRAFRFPWQGFPTWPPELTAVVEDNQVYLYFSWNGSTETDAYFVEGGQDAQGLVTLAKVTKNGFETGFTFEMPGEGIWYFRVRPISEEGDIGPASPVVMVVTGGRPVYLPLVAAGDGSVTGN